MIISIEFPTSSARIQGSFKPTLAVELYSGSFADSVREDPAAVAICSAIDGSLVKCVPLGGDGVSAQPSVKPPSDEGIGHNQHSFEVWLAARRGEPDRPSASSSLSYSHLWDPVIQGNASVIFSSRPPASLHMPDDTSVFYAQCDDHRGQWEAAEVAAHPPPNQAEAPFLVHGDDGNSGGLYDEERDGRSLPMARGVLHIGANVANEAASYSDCVGGGGANVRFAPIP